MYQAVIAAGWSLADYTLVRVERQLTTSAVIHHQQD